MEILYCCQDRKALSHNMTHDLEHQYKLLASRAKKDNCSSISAENMQIKSLSMQTIFSFHNFGLLWLLN